MAKMTAAMAEKINRAHKLGYGIGRSGEAQKNIKGAGVSA